MQVRGGDRLPVHVEPDGPVRRIELDLGECGAETTLAVREIAVDGLEGAQHGLHCVVVCEVEGVSCESGESGELGEGTLELRRVLRESGRWGRKGKIPGGNDAHETVAKPGRDGLIQKKRVATGDHPIGEPGGELGLLLEENAGAVRVDCEVVAVDAVGRNRGQLVRRVLRERVEPDAFGDLSAERAELADEGGVVPPEMPSAEPIVTARRQPSSPYAYAPNPAFCWANVGLKRKTFGPGARWLSCSPSGIRNVTSGWS